MGNTFMMARIKKFFAADRHAQRKMLRGKLQQLAGYLASILPNGPVRLTYSPESVWIVGAHPEVDKLFPKWTHSNRLNAADVSRYFSLILNLKQCIQENIPGDFVELGVYKGNSASILADLAAKCGKRVFLFDTFSGFHKGDLTGIDSNKPMLFSDTSVEGVRAVVGNEGHCVYIKGVFPESITEEVRSNVYCFVHLDCDLYMPMRDALSFFYPRLSMGGQYSSTTILAGGGRVRLRLWMSSALKQEKGSSFFQTDPALRVSGNRFITAKIMRETASYRGDGIMKFY
jgi:hypothetical protein